MMVNYISFYGIYFAGGRNLGASEAHTRTFYTPLLETNWYEEEVIEAKNTYKSISEGKPKSR